MLTMVKVIEGRKFFTVDCFSYKSGTSPSKKKQPLWLKGNLLCCQNEQFFPEEKRIPLLG